MMPKASVMQMTSSGRVILFLTGWQARPLLRTVLLGERRADVLLQQRVDARSQ